MLSQSGVGFASECSGAVLKELSLPLVEHRGMDLVVVAEVGDGYSVDQIASKDGHFLIRRVLITSLGHDENLLSNYSLFEKGFSPFSLGAKQVLRMALYKCHSSYCYGLTYMSRKVLNYLFRPDETVSQHNTI